MDLTKYPVLHPQIATRVVDGSAVIILADSGEVNVLNAVGTRIWQLADGTRSAQDILNAIVAEYDVTPQKAAQDVERFLQQLEGEHALVFQDSPTLSGAQT